MENWGLVTYRETCLLVDDENTSTQRRQWVAIVVGHELAHQWFGNLVTMVMSLFSRLQEVFHLGSSQRSSQHAVNHITDCPE